MTDNTFPTLPLHPTGGCNETNTCTPHTITTQLVQSFDGLQRSGNVATLGCCPTTPRQNSYRGRIGRHVRTYFIMPETQLHVTGSSTSPFGLSQRKSVITSLKFKKKKKRKYKKRWRYMFQANLIPRWVLSYWWRCLANLISSFQAFCSRSRKWSLFFWRWMVFVSSVIFNHLS